MRFWWPDQMNPNRLRASTWWWRSVKCQKSSAKGWGGGLCGTVLHLTLSLSDLNGPILASLIIQYLPLATKKNIDWPWLVRSQFLTSLKKHLPHSLTKMLINFRVLMQYDWWVIFIVVLFPYELHNNHTQTSKSISFNSMGSRPVSTVT